MKIAATLSNTFNYRWMTTTLNMWWRGLLYPDEGARLILSESKQPGFLPFLILLTCLGCTTYGLSMGLFTSWPAAIVTAVKAPFPSLCLATIMVLPLYVHNGVHNEKVCFNASLRFIFYILSANAVTLLSLSPIACFITLTTSAQGYPVLVVIHVGLIALAGLAAGVAGSALWGGLIDKQALKKQRLFLLFLLLISGTVYIQLVWLFRPWVGIPGTPFTLFRAQDDSAIDAFIRLVQHLTSQ